MLLKPKSCEKHHQQGLEVHALQGRQISGARLGCLHLHLLLGMLCYCCNPEPLLMQGAWPKV